MSEEVRPQKTDASPCGGNESPCLEAKEHVWDFIDGELGPDDCARIKSHVDACDTCVQLFHSEQKIKDVVARACGCEPAPQDLRGRISAMLQRLRIETCGGAGGAND